MTGSGTAGDPYMIESYSDLNDVRNDLAAYYELAHDINCSGQGPMVPIGTLSAGFTGSFDGMNHVISNLSVNPSLYRSGIFGYTSGAIIKDFTVNTITISSSTSNAAYYVGSIVGDAESGTEITNVHVKNFTSIFTVSNAQAHIGGFAGKIGSSAIILKCSVDTGTLAATPPNLTANPQETAGFVHTTSGGSIEKCYTAGLTLRASRDTGSVNLGGFAISIGTGTTIQNCYAKNTLDTSYGNKSSSTATGIAQSTAAHINRIYSACNIADASLFTETGFVNAQSTFNTTYCFYDYTLTPYPARQTGSGTAAVGEETEHMKMQSTFSSVFWDFSGVWAIDNTSSINEGYPYLIDNPPVAVPVVIVPIPEDDPIEPIEYIGLYRANGSTSRIEPAILKFPNTTLGQPGYDKRINFLDIEYIGTATIYLYGNSQLHHSKILSSATRKLERVFIPLEKRYPKEKFQIKIETTDPNFILYNTEIDYSLARRKYE